MTALWTVSDGLGDSVYEPSTDDGEVIDLDAAFGDDEVDALLDTSYSPPERPRGLDAFGTTLAEQRDGESLDQRLAQEEPDPALAVDEGGSYPVDEGAGDHEVGEARAGRLVAPDEGAHEDAEKDMVASDVGIDGGAASAEEAAVHVVPDEDIAVDEGSSI
jgi:hypothetical protein